MKTQNVVSFSGGKDSTAMLLRMIEEGVQVDRVIFVDTTKEFPGMYAHIDKVQSMIPIKIEVIKIEFDYWFGEHIKTRGKNKGKRGYGFPDFRNRWCTALKQQAAKRVQKTIGLRSTQFHGIAYDEKERAKKNPNRDIRYPLIEWGMTEKDCLDYCYSKGLDWGGLYTKFHRVSCWCCPLSRIGELRILHNEFPELWEELEIMDTKSYRSFRSDYSLAELTERFTEEKTAIRGGIK